MPDLPKKKVGIVACSGEELPEGTVTRLAALKVLEEMRPADTVTICLPLFLAGGEGDRVFAKFYPTIAIDGCELRCAARGTEMYSGKPAANVVVTELYDENGFGQPAGLRKLNDAGMKAVDITAERVTELVDELLEKRWSRREGKFVEDTTIPVVELEQPQEPVVASCACGSGIPVQKININGKTVSIIALPLIFEQLRKTSKAPDPTLVGELLDTVKIYNTIPEGSEEAYASVLLREYELYCQHQEVSS
jgi:uncharacterized metal-binding protein